MALTDLIYGKGYRCENCGESYNTEEEAKHCYKCRIGFFGGVRTCPECNGSGVKVNWGAPNEKCGNCGGTGKLAY